MTRVYQTKSKPAVVVAALSSTFATLKKSALTILCFPLAYFGFPYFYSFYQYTVNRTFFKLQAWLGLDANFSFYSELSNMVNFNTFQGSTELAELWRSKQPTGSIRLILSNYVTDMIVGIF